MTKTISSIRTIECLILKGNALRFDWDAKLEINSPYIYNVF